MNQIKPYLLWVGHAGDCRAFNALHDLGIRAIVQLAIDEAPITAPREFLYFRLLLTDGAENNAEVLRLAIDSVSTLIAMQIPTLVACGAGMKPLSGSRRRRNSRARAGEVHRRPEAHR